MEDLRRKKLIKENEKKAKEIADKNYPDEKWEKFGERIYVSPRRERGDKLMDELRNAKILRDLGSTVYLVPENNRKQNETQYDAIVNGLIMEFKNMTGKAKDTLITHFYRSRKQAPNVFINLEESPLSHHQALSILKGARHSPKYDDKNKFPEGGLLILKIKCNENLYYYDIGKL